MFNRIFAPLGARATQVLFVTVFSGVLGYEYGMATSAKIPVKDTEKPILTVAGVVHVCPEGKIALIQRGKDPKGLAMFGGHVEKKEAPETAFAREAKEELNIDVENVKLIGLHGKYGRDPRQHSVEGTYTCTTSQIPYAGSDAKSVHLYTPSQIEKMLRQNPQGFAFDHGDILAKYIQKLGDCDPCKKSR